ncbi:MAG: hypothetical protein ACT4N8_08875 [Sphingosinicella sp.]
MVDEEYLHRTGDKIPVGQRLFIASDDVVEYLTAVQRAVVAIASAAEAVELEIDPDSHE